MAARKTTGQAQATAATRQTPIKKGATRKPLVITIKPAAPKEYAAALARMADLVTTKRGLKARPGLLATLAAGQVFVPMKPETLSNRTARAKAHAQGATILTLPTDDHTVTDSKGNEKRIEVTPDRNTIQKTWFGNGLPAGSAYLSVISPAMLAAWNLPALSWVEDREPNGQRVVRIFATHADAVYPDPTLDA